MKEKCNNIFGSKNCLRNLGPFINKILIVFFLFLRKFIHVILVPVKSNLFNHLFI